MSQLQATLSRPPRVKGKPELNLDSRSSSGTIFWVDSNRGSDDNDGKAPDRALATWDAAVNKTTTNNGDVIVLMENHAENIATADAVDFDTAAGVKTIGLGNGTNRPTITAITSTAAEIQIAATDIEISNVVFVCNITNQVNMINVAASGCGFYIHDCEFNETGAVGLASIVIAGAADDCRIEDNRFYSIGANGDHAIAIDAVVDRTIIKDNLIYGDYDDACIHSASAHLQTRVEGNTLINVATGQHAIEFSAAATGVIHKNFIGGDTTGTSGAIDPGSCYVGQNLWNTAGDNDPLPSCGLSSGGSTYLGRHVSKALLTDATGDLFTVTGKNLIMLMHGEMTTAETGATSSLTVALNMKTNSIDIAAATAILADVIGTLYIVNGDQDELLNGTDAPSVDYAGTGAQPLSPFIVDGDAIEATIAKGGGTSAGVITWSIHYHPLEAGASIVAA